MDFYDQIAENYDRMTNLDSRMDGIRKFARRIKDRYNLESAIDVACGTGRHAIIMSQMGIRAVGADMSAGMLDKARTFANQIGVQVQWIGCPMQELSQHVNEKFDIVLCLGNSLPHILNQDDLDRTISGFAKLLQPGGVLLIQLLNYHQILKQKKRIVAVTKNENREFIRFYDFLPELIQFNVLQIEWQTEPPIHTLSSTTLFPYTPDILKEALQKHKFLAVSTYADLDFIRFDRNKSSNLVVEAYR